MARGAKVELLKGSMAEQGTGEGWLIVDDLVDTGRTGRLVREMLPKAARIQGPPNGAAAPLPRGGIQLTGRSEPTGDRPCMK